MRRKIALVSTLLGVVGIGTILWLGARLCAANPVSVGPLPSDLVGEAVLIPSQSGSQLHGWLIPGRPGAVPETDQ